MPVLKYSPLNGEQHVVRRCPYQSIERDAHTNQVVGLNFLAMRLRTEKGETYLSVNWLEGHQGTKGDRLKALVDLHRKKSQSGRISPMSGLAVVNVGIVVQIGANHSKKLAVKLTSTQLDPTYSRIVGLPLDNGDEMLLGALADEAYKDFMTVGDIEKLP